MHHQLAVALRQHRAIVDGGGTLALGREQPCHVFERRLGSKGGCVHVDTEQRWAAVARAERVERCRLGLDRRQFGRQRDKPPNRHRHHHGPLGAHHHQVAHAELRIQQRPPGLAESGVRGRPAELVAPEARRTGLELSPTRQVHVAEAPALALAICSLHRPDVVLAAPVIPGVLERHHASPPSKKVEVPLAKVLHLPVEEPLHPCTVGRPRLEGRVCQHAVAELEAALALGRRARELGQPIGVRQVPSQLVARHNQGAALGALQRHAPDLPRLEVPAAGRR